MAKKVYVLMFDDDGSKEKGVPIAVFHHRQTYGSLMDYVPSQTIGDIKELFSNGSLWYVTTSMSSR